MPAKIYRIKLSNEERLELESVRDKGSHKAIKYRRAVTLLLSDESDYGPANNGTQIAKVTRLHIDSIEKIRKRC